MNQDNVEQVLAREEVRASVRAKAIAERRRIAALVARDGGKEGALVSKVDIRISGKRSEKLTMRAKPGTFSWRYGRNKQDAMFHAGNHFAICWERAGCTVASSVDFLRGTRSGFSTGIAEGRIAAIDNLAGAVEELGRFTFERLMDYCVLGLTTSQIARKHGQADRDMAAVLHQDLRSCAMHFRFL